MPLLSEIRQEVVGVIGRQVIHVDCRAQTKVLTAVLLRRGGLPLAFCRELGGVPLAS